MNEISIIATNADQSKRMDKFLTDFIKEHLLPDLSRARLQALIDQGMVLQNGAVASIASTKIKAGDHFTLTLPPPEPIAAHPQNIPLTILFEDEDLIIVDKPPFLVVHPDPAHPDGTLVNALLHHCGARLSGIGGALRPGIVHRLDKDTSGLIVCAKTSLAHIGLAEQFAHHKSDGGLVRGYQALVWGQPPPGPETIDAPIGRHPVHRRKMAVRQFGGRAAQTEFRLIKRVGAQASLLGCRLFTGRTHQIRVHLLARGWGIVGDRLYYQRKNVNRITSMQRQALHANLLEFIHPRTKAPLCFESPLSEDIQQAIQALETDDMPSPIKPAIV